jgi:putative protein-disulfide isomerase|tara:strand:+ start:12511 stop:12915 length:405 start_codon:yes stop_codon:yes gene_type:complete
MKAQETKPQLIYVGDPMCSWCYGFSDELIEIAQAFKNNVYFKIIVGGLKPYTKVALAYFNICDQYKVSFDDFKSAFESDDFKQLTKNDFGYSQQMGVRGFPSMILIKNNKATLVSNGYQKTDGIINTINKLIEE